MTIQAGGLTPWLWILPCHGSNSHIPHGQLHRFLVALHQHRAKIHPQNQAVGTVPITGHLDHLCITAFPTALVLTSSTEELLGMSVLQDSLLLSTLTPVLAQPGEGLMAALIAAPENPIMQNEAVDNWAIPPREASVL